MWTSSFSQVPYSLSLEFQPFQDDSRAFGLRSDFIELIWRVLVSLASSVDEVTGHDNVTHSYTHARHVEIEEREAGLLEKL